MSFFNFNSTEPSVIWAQIDTLERKFKKWSIVPGIEGERKVRAYALEALIAYVGLSDSHPAKEMLERYFEYLKNHGYKVVEREEGVVILSSRNTYVSAARDEYDPGKRPECVGLGNLIIAQARHGQPMND